MSLVPAGDPAEVFAATLRTDMPIWGKAIRKGNIAID